MQKAIGIVVVLLVAMWLIAPTQTEALVKSAVDLISHRISQSDTSTPKGHASAELGEVLWPLARGRGAVAVEVRPQA